MAFDQALDLQTRYASRFDTTFLRGLLSTTYLHLNNDKPILSDKRVRQAIMLGIDRQSIVSSVYENKLPVANSIISSTAPNYDKDIKAWP